MKVIIDTNCLFSSIIKPDGKIAEIILNPKFDLTIIGCYFSYIELFKYKEKMIKASKLEEVEFFEVLYQVIKRVSFINEGTIPSKIFEKAYNLTRDIDEKDTVFVAMSDFLNCKIWTGDIILIEGLKEKGFKNFIRTSELLQILLNK